jgi:formate hydrogenlyase subunit 3/multisubunit Na+/H+ antiporter MnhD subunit
VSPIPAALATATTLGVAGAVVAGGKAALGGSRWSAEIPGLLPLAGTHLAVDALSALFMAVAGLIHLLARVGRSTGVRTPTGALRVPARQAPARPASRLHHALAECRGANR